MERKMKILHLTLEKKWFDMMVKGEKDVEYRSKKPYWKKRLEHPNGMFIIFDEIHFRNGYKKNNPFMRRKHETTYMTSWLGGEVYALNLGKILELKNYGGKK